MKKAPAPNPVHTSAQSQTDQSRLPEVKDVEPMPDEAKAACWAVSDAVELYTREALDNAMSFRVDGFEVDRALTAACVQACATIHAADVQAQATKTHAQALDRVSDAMAQLVAANTRHAPATPLAEAVPAAGPDTNALQAEFMGEWMALEGDLFKLFEARHLELRALYERVYEGEGLSATEANSALVSLERHQSAVSDAFGPLDRAVRGLVNKLGAYRVPAPVAAMDDCMGTSWPALPADSLQFAAFEKVRRIGSDAVDGATVFHDGVEYGINADNACTLTLTHLTLERLDGAAKGAQSSMAVLKWDKRDTSDVNGLGLAMNALAVGVSMPGRREVDPSFRVLPVLPVPACYRRADEADSDPDADGVED